jgi:hypothetical protein
MNSFWLNASSLAFCQPIAAIEKRVADRGQDDDNQGERKEGSLSY